MPQSRKTKQQKIKQTQRKTQSPDLNHSIALEAIPDNNVMHSGFNREIAETHLYVVGELKRISWISIICLAILAIATILLADFSWASAIREWLPF